MCLVPAVAIPSFGPWLLGEMQWQFSELVGWRLCVLGGMQAKL